MHEAAALLICPACGQSLRPKDGALLCRNKHRFDTAKEGYINLLMKNKSKDTYDKASFTARHAFLQKGYYAPMAEALLQCVTHAKVPGTVLDAGCGEGYFARFINSRIDTTLLGLDLSKESVRLAAKQDPKGLYIVGDIKRIPVKDHALSCLINAFTPADYQSFFRVLSPKGTLIKIIPGDSHLRELRVFLNDVQAYDSAEVVHYFKRHARMVHRQSVCCTVPLPEEDAYHLIHMTPLFFRRDRDAIPPRSVPQITLHAEILVGKAPL